ncbi:MAG: DedA family protein [Kofleriaceae bacterium]
MLHDFAVWVQSLVVSMGYPGLFILIVLESTMVPIPSLLVMPFAGFLAAQGHFSLPVILIINTAGALTGSGLSYWLGAAGGKPLLLKYGKYVLVRPKDIEKTEAYFAKHGTWTILVGRFLPVIRHIISIPAGVARMPLVPFFSLTGLGASLWGGGLMVLGYVLGARWTQIESKAKSVDHLIALAIVVAIMGAALYFYFRRRKERARAAAATTAASDSAST